MRPVIYAGLVVGLTACSCAEVHEVDGGAVDALVRDAPLRDGPLADAMQFDDAGCERIAGLRRCDSVCPYACTRETGRCVPSVGVCFAGYPAGGATLPDNCYFTNANVIGVGEYCWTGLPCAATYDPLPDAGAGVTTYAGACMPPEFCIAARDAGLPPFHCVWSDGTDMITGPPPGTCPAAPDPTYGFCGGACGIIQCPGDGSGNGGACVGVSDTRSFGVCMPYSQTRCERNQLSMTQQTLDTGLAISGHEFACLVPLPQPPGTRSQFGFPIYRSVCLAYRSQFPANADCVDGTWTSLP